MRVDGAVPVVAIASHDGGIAVGGVVYRQVEGDNGIAAVGIREYVRVVTALRSFL